MFIESQPTTVITKDELLAKVKQLQTDGFRIVQVCATTLANEFEVTYSFDKNYALQNLRVMVARNDAVLPSITDSYLCAFAYENELHDLFGISFTGLAIDFKGTFYRKSAATPFATPPKQSTDK